MVDRKPISVQKSLRDGWFATVRKQAKNGHWRHHIVKGDTHQEALTAAYEKLKEDA